MTSIADRSGARDGANLGGDVVPPGRGAAIGPYLRPSWFERRILPALMRRFSRMPVLRVRGRASGGVRVIIVRPVEVGGSRYLVALLGDTHWARDLRAAGTAELVEGGVSRAFRTQEVFGEERTAAVARYRQTSTYAPTERLLTERLPNPEDHPVFRIG